MTERKTYSKAFELEAVHLAEANGNLSQTTRDRGIHQSMLGKWKRLFRDHGEQVFPGSGNPKDEELAHLRKELKRLEEENAILK